VKNLKMQVLERDRKIERLNQHRVQQEKIEDGCYVGYQEEDITNLDSTDCLVEDDGNDLENNMDAS
jgi:hypothetical protein